MKSILSILLLLASLNGFAAGFNPYDGPMPLAVYVETNPWAMVLGADTPRVVVYENGSVIFLKESGDRVDYFHKVLSTAEFAEFKRRLEPAIHLKDLKPFYNMRPGVTDQPESMFYVRESAREMTTRVYGLANLVLDKPGYTYRPDKRNPQDPPSELVDLYRFLDLVNYPGARKWTPSYIEVMFRPYPHSLKPALAWPRHWSGLGSDRSFKRGNSYSIFLDGSSLPELREFLGGGPVEAGEKKWAVSYRYVFPSTPVWSKHFQYRPDKAIPD